MIGGIKVYKSKKKGFTLVELLAVIVILAIILAIAVPSISTMVSSAKKSSFEDNVKLIIKGIDYKVFEAQAANETGPTTGTKETTELANYGANPTDYCAFVIDTVSPTTISLTGASSGKFGPCTVTKASMSNLTFSGTAGTAGVISGCK
jgi:type IV pilus assembly protein PilA